MNALKLIPIAGALAVLLCLPSAQAWPGKKGHKATVTGCLMKGNQPNEYVIIQNGYQYELHPKSGVHLSRLVGHKVQVSGKLAAPPSGGANTAARTSAERVDVTHYKDFGAKCP